MCLQSTVYVNHHRMRFEENVIGSVEKLIHLDPIAQAKYLS